VREYLGLFGEEEGTHEAGTVTEIVVLVVLGKIQHICNEQLGLLGVGDVQLGRQIDNLGAQQWRGVAERWIVWQPVSSRIG